MSARPIRIRAPVATLAFYTLLLLTDATGLIRMSLWAALLHECGHFAAWWVLTGRAPRAELSVLGLRLSLQGRLLPPDRQLILAAAGPLTNLLLCSGLLLAQEWSASVAGYRFACVNLLLGAFNLLPLGKLDGAQIWSALHFGAE